MWDITLLLAESWDNHTMVFDSFLCYFRLFDNLLKSSLNCKYIQHDASLFFRSKWYAIVWPESGIIKGTVRHQVKNIYFPLSCSAGYLSRLLWCDLQSFRDIVCRDVCLLWNVMELDGTRPAVHRAAKKAKKSKSSTAKLLSRNRDSITQDNPIYFLLCGVMSKMTRRKVLLPQLCALIFLRNQRNHLYSIV